MGTLNKTSERFTNAVTKLYNAFHKGELNGLDCTKCAVGNICDNNGAWADVSCAVLSIKRYHGESKCVIDKTGYSPQELRYIEEIFLTGVKEGGFWESRLMHDKDSQFKGLCAVVEYLCELEGIPNVMDYTCLFETENDEPKYKLENVL